MIRIANYVCQESRGGLIGSHSESSLPLGPLPGGPVPRSRTPTYFSDGDDAAAATADVVSAIRSREERKLALQMEIGLRKLQLEETRYLQNELAKLAEMPDISPIDIDRARNLYRQRVRLHEQVTVPAASASSLHFSSAQFSFSSCFLDCQLLFFHMHVLLFILPFIPLLYSLLSTLLRVRL